MGNEAETTGLDDDLQFGAQEKDGLIPVGSGKRGERAARPLADTLLSKNLGTVGREPYSRPMNSSHERRQFPDFPRRVAPEAALPPSSLLMVRPTGVSGCHQKNKFLAVSIRGLTTVSAAIDGTNQAFTK